MNFPSKTYQKNGRWVEKPSTTVVSICICKNKYIKTRDKQTRCLRCIGLAIAVAKKNGGLPLA
ncbi:MAG: hypothetical protein AAB665_02430 [Patescibacteria group bacterium]